MRSSLVAEWVKDLALLLLWQEFNLWPGNFPMPWARPKKKKKKKKSHESKSAPFIGHFSTVTAQLVTAQLVQFYLSCFTSTEHRLKPQMTMGTTRESLWGRVLNARQGVVTFYFKPHFEIFFFFFKWKLWYFLTFIMLCRPNNTWIERQVGCGPWTAELWPLLLFFGMVFLYTI